MAPITGLGTTGLLRDVATLAIGAGLAQALTLAAAPVLSRLYAPEAFGVLAWFSSTSIIVAVTVTLRYETEILLPKEDAEAAQIVELALACVVLGTVLFAMSAWLLPTSAYGAPAIRLLAPWTSLAALGGGLAAATMVLSARSNRYGAYRQLTLCRVSQAVTRTGLAIVFGGMGVTSGQIWASLLAVGVGVAVLVRGGGGTRHPLHTRIQLMAVARKHAAAPKYVLPAGLLGTITQQLPVYLITLRFSIALAGQFSVAWQVLALPIRLIGESVGQVFLQRFSQAWPDRPTCRRLLYSTWIGLAVIDAAPTAIVMVWGPDLFAWVFGSPWREAGRIASLLAPLLYVLFIASTTSMNAIVMGQQRLCLLIDIALTLWRGCAFLVADRYSLDFGLIAWAWGEIALIVIRNLAVLRVLYVSRG